MEKEQPDMREPSSSTTKADPPKEVEGSASEFNSSHEGDKEDRMTSEEDKTHSPCETHEGYTKVCSYLVGIKKSKQTDLSNTKPDPTKEVEDSTSEVNPSHDGDKEDTMTSEGDKIHRKSEKLEGYTKVCGYHVKIKKLEESDTVMILDEVQSESSTEKQDKVDTQKPGETNTCIGDDSTVSHSNLTMPGSQNKNKGESESLAMTKSQSISATSVQYSTDYTEISEQEMSEPPQKKSRTDADLVVDISKRDTPDNTDVIEVIQIDPLVDGTRTDNQLQSNTVQESTDFEIIENKDTGMKQAKADFDVAQSKAVSDVILIDEQNTDSRGSAATDDSVIFVDESMKENTSDTQQPSTSQHSLLYDFSRTPRLITGAWKCYESSNHENYLRGCKWAPDGTCLLTCSNDNCLRLFNLPPEMYMEGGEDQNIPEMVPVLKMKEADTIYDYCWYPQMSSASPETACLAVTSKDTPIHLYDAFTGELRCSYRAFNHVDEVAPAHSLSFNHDGTKLYCGFNKMIRVFDVTRPGREFENRPTFGKIIRIYQELLDRIDKTVSRVTVWRHKALQSDAYQWPVAQICLSIPATHDRISFFEVT